MAVPGLTELQESEMCCGSAGLHKLTEPVVTANPGCILQIAAGLCQRGVAMRVLHIVELLDQACAAGEGGAAS